MNIRRYTAYVLVLIGAFNWGLVGLFGINLVSVMFGDMTILSRIIYSLVGISAIVALFFIPYCENSTECKPCECKTLNY